MSDSKSKGPGFISKCFPKFSAFQIYRSISKGRYPNVSKVHFNFFRGGLLWQFFNSGCNCQNIHFFKHFLYSAQVRDPGSGLKSRILAPLFLKHFLASLLYHLGSLLWLTGFWGHKCDFSTTQYSIVKVSSVIILPSGQVMRSFLQRVAPCLVINPGWKSIMV